MADLFDHIPSLDLNQFTKGSEEERKEFVAKLGDAFHRIGFVAIKNHGLTDALTEKLYSVVKEFFALPEDVKRKYDRPELHGQRGYTSKGKEHAKGRTTADLKEFYQIGQFVEGDDPVKEIYPDNIWPSEVPEMHPTAKEAYQTLEAAGKQLLRAIALYLGLKEDYFEPQVHNGNSIIRAIHYYPIKNPDEVPDDAVRAAEHGDINLITLLMGASAEGLQVLRRDGEWIPITALPDQIIVNVGDMLARLTNDNLKSTIHRVVNPPRELLGTPRYSIPFFMHPRAEMDLTCLTTCISEEEPKKYTDMTAGEFLDERLREIGLKQ
uniref:2-oxoglutarate and iron-dependent oxygenase domain-containing protein n=1 Tax=Roseihalotalea indica TaxID=2867963 RepID=A0AA49JJW5_9BACT|nr:2-oxoglutarate and iron-dependent oxygenase domain-containing protein [Tunicatimonas sp. TK19036]